MPPHRRTCHQVLPYWGNLADRKTLRRLLAPSRLYGRAAPFHVALTSYQIAVADEAVLKKVKWQFMILDEAQVRAASLELWCRLFTLSCRLQLPRWHAACATCVLCYPAAAA
jgi:DNA helicase INO80